MAEAAATAASAKEGDPDINRKRKDVRVTCREVIDLYEDEMADKIKELVKKARDLAASVPNR